MEPCLFCFEPVSSTNPLGCVCRFQAHKECLDKWFAEKNQMECPICHTVSFLNPITIIYIRPTEERIRFNPIVRNERAGAICCFIFLAISFALTILNLVARY